MNDTLWAAAHLGLQALENGRKVRNCEGDTLFQPPLEDAAILALRTALMGGPKRSPLTSCPPLPPASLSAVNTLPPAAGETEYEVAPIAYADGEEVESFYSAEQMRAYLEAVQQALLVLEHNGCAKHCGGRLAIDSLRAALVQMPAQSERYSLSPGQLRPCPFCGSRNLEEDATGCAEIWGNTYQSGWISCKDCGADGPRVELTDETPAQNDFQKVRNVWNQRGASR